MKFVLQPLLKRKKNTEQKFWKSCRAWSEKPKKKINAFTDEEEAEVKLIDVVPFLLEDRLRERGQI